MEVLKVMQVDWLNEAEKYIKGGLHKIAYVEIEKPVAIVHRKSQVDENVCKELGYDVYEAFNNGGTIISNAGDIVIGHFYHHDNGWCDRWANYLVDRLKDRGLNAEYKDNDVLVDDYKVCGMCITRYGRIDYTGGIIGINTKLDDIKKICQKPMKKVPKGLAEYGITTEEVEQMFLDFCAQDEQLITK